MKTCFASAALMLLSLTSHAACTAADFQIRDFKMAMDHGGMRNRLSLKGALVNHCAEPAAAEVAIVAKDSSGKIVRSRKGWPAGTANIGPGESVVFDLGGLFRNLSNVDTFSVGVVSVHTW